VKSFVLAYVIGHLRLIYRQWFRWALMRAVHYCTSVEDFDQERLNLELTFLVNWYSLDYVTTVIDQFFNEFRTTIYPGNLHQTSYEKLRHRLLQKIDREKQARQQQLQLTCNQKMVHLYYLYDWGPRHTFNQNFDPLRWEYFEKDSTFAATGVEIKLRTKHCYSLNALLAPQAPSS
jgi:hypothetical protein